MKRTGSSMADNLRNLIAPEPCQSHERLVMPKTKPSQSYNHGTPTDQVLNILVWTLEISEQRRLRIKARGTSWKIRAEQGKTKKNIRILLTFAARTHQIKLNNDLGRDVPFSTRLSQRCLRHILRGIFALPEEKQKLNKNIPTNAKGNENSFLSHRLLCMFTLLNWIGRERSGGKVQFQSAPHTSNSQLKQYPTNANADL